MACNQGEGSRMRAVTIWNSDSEKNSPMVGIGLYRLKYIIQSAAGTERITLSLEEEVHSRKVVGKMYGVLKNLCYNRSFPVSCKATNLLKKGSLDLFLLRNANDLNKFVFFGEPLNGCSVIGLKYVTSSNSLGPCTWKLLDGNNVSLYNSTFFKNLNKIPFF